MGCKIIADDYGMSWKINGAISELVSKSVISKVSIMANEAVRFSGKDMTKVETGLHINLLFYSKGAGIDRSIEISPLKLLYLIYTQQLTDERIKESINHQFDFLEDRGFEISYMDTHQYVHIIPRRLLDLLTIIARARGIKSIRCITLEKQHVLFYFLSLIRFGFWAQVPKMVLLYSLGLIMKARLNRSRMNYCKNLILIPLASGGDYSGLLKMLLKRFKNEDAEFVTHPGLKDDNNKVDEYSYGRYTEYSSLLDLHSREKWQ